MPQLDSMTFFTQFFWFSVGFIFLYAYMLHYVIPALSSILKFRNKKLDNLALDVNKNKTGAGDLLVTYNQLILRSFKLFRINFVKTTEESTSWFESNNHKIISDNFANANKQYLLNIGEQNYKNLLFKVNSKGYKK
uniref:ATP synthase F0 subunit 8 n=1 Tax=Proteomonas sulcata TaxID=77928 RepID=A0A2P1G8A6_9CRYP|nr:ATP synthase F0 subunit 8 [Proteomonas sulcata]AVM81180.1 ATP synthase F0 subunit 8 [Proteomonas sulcata]